MSWSVTELDFPKAGICGRRLTLRTWLTKDLGERHQSAYGQTHNLWTL